MKQVKSTIKIAFQTVIILLLASCSVKHNAEFDISGVGDDEVIIENYLLTSMDEDPIFDTVYAKSGKFFYDIPVLEPVISIITPTKAMYLRSSGSTYRPEHKSVILILQPEDHICVVGKLEHDKLSYEVVFSRINEEDAKLRERYVESQIEASMIELTIDSLRSIEGFSKRVSSLYQKRKELSKIKEEAQLDFIKNNPGSELAAIYLIRQPMDTFDKYLPKLSKEVRDGLFSEILDEQQYMIQKFRRIGETGSLIQPGKRAQPFRLVSNCGQEYSFDPENLDKFIVLDFWGTWCTPCITGIPKMKEYYEKYRDKFEIIGIACNDTESKWKDAVQKYNLGWTNLINNKEDFEKDVSVIYAVESYPSKIIINSDGIIEDIFIGEGDDFYAKLDMLMVNKLP